MHIKRKLTFILILLSVISIEAWSTHIRAGEITAVRISQTSLRYRFTIVIYSDTGSQVQVGDGGRVDFGQGTILDGAGSGDPRAYLESFDENGAFEVTALGNEVERTVMTFVFTFDGPGSYCVSYTEQNRNDNIININGGASAEIPFHIETCLRIDPAFGLNGTPVLTTPPIDRACIGSQFIHNPAAYDPDGDSLAYKLLVPMQERGQTVQSFLPLDNPAISDQREDGGSPATYAIDSLTGNFVWDAPMIPGEYNAAFIVEEWRFSELTRRWELLGYVTRDMQIVVEDCDNDRPELIIPEDICVEAGTFIDQQIVGTDPDNDRIKLEAFGGTFEVPISPSEFIPPGRFRNQPTISNFQWLTDISHVRDRPYEVTFKVSDEPSDPDAPSLVDFKTWRITVVAPAPEGLNSSIVTARSIQLVWDEYTAANFAPVMQVWRREESFDFTAENCEVGIPENSGYVLLDELPIGQLNYLDDNEVRPGVKYCYRIMAKFPLPSGGESYASLETCVTIPIDVPAITNVSVENTSLTNGEIIVKWTPPLEIDQTLFPPPYRYELVRYTGLSGEADGQVLTSTPDLLYVDTNLNTLTNPYHYTVTLFDSGDNLVDNSAPASSVRLEAFGLLRSVELTWEAVVPWSNRSQDHPYHYIYRNRTDDSAEDTTNYILIDSLNTTENGLLYLDEGNFNSIPLLDDREYCYFVVTQGSYGNVLIDAPLINNSQKICVRPNDNIPPDDPEIIVPAPSDTVFINGEPVFLLESQNCEIYANEPCGFTNYSNTLDWEADNIDGDIAGFNIYFSPSGEPDSYNIVGTSRESSFTHTGLSSLKGCYKVSAVDRSNNESGLSMAICFDNCPSYELPNAFTPNGDNVNDTFKAFDQPNSQCPRFAQSVEFHVFNRWGGDELFTYNSLETTEGDLFINWDGRDNNGNELAAGTYYYLAIVTFDVFAEDKKVQEFKNWVNIIR